MSSQVKVKNEDQGKAPGHQITIIVNGQEKTVEDKELSFDELVSLAHDGNPPTGPNWFFTITYRRGNGDKPEGSLLEGESVKVKKNMVFNVTSTDRS